MGCLVFILLSTVKLCPKRYYIPEAQLLRVSLEP
jgi:hypothetical protein